METKDNAKFYIVLVKGWIEYRGKFLLAQRGMNEVHKPGAWSVPGGKVEDAETTYVVEKTLKKEIKEEVGLDITDDIELIYNNTFQRVDGAHVVNLTFLCHALSDAAQSLEDTTQVQWMTPEELKNFPDAEDFLRIEIDALSAFLQKKQALLPKT